MTTVKCQHTGIEFDADSKRTKMHPAISGIKNAAAKDGTYRQVMAAITATEKETWTSIEEAVEFINDMAAGRITAKRQADREAGATKKAAEMAAKESKQRRIDTNSTLYRYGYVWTYEDEESMDIFGATAIDTIGGNGWKLSGPDGRNVTVAQAMKEIRNR